jgi:hypothetical protein
MSSGTSGLLVIIGFGAAAFGWRFRLYSAATFVVTLAFGALSGSYGSNIADDLETPWVRVIERTSVYAYQLWIVVFATAVLAGSGLRSPTSMRWSRFRTEL